jgi:hypothetical protein
MIPEIVATLAAVLSTKVAKEALAKAIQIYNVRKNEQVTLEWHTDDTVIRVDSSDIRAGGDILIVGVKPTPGKEETPEGATRSTREVIATQLTILEKERDRLIPIATREHWVALIFVVIAGIVFFTSVGLFIFGTLAQGIPTLLASMIPGFLGRTFFKREHDIEKRLKEISSDLRESERVKERLEIIEEALQVIPEEFRERVLEDFTKTRIKPQLVKR